jgi:hypothetical protein
LISYKNNILEVIESFHAIKTGKLEEGSVARVIDCCPQPVDPFQCIIKLGGLCRAADYPITTGQCIADKCKPVITVSTITYSLIRSLNWPKFHYAEKS